MSCTVLKRMISSSLRLATGSFMKDVSSPGKLTIFSSLLFNNIRDIHITSNTAKEFRMGTQKVRATIKGKAGLMDGEGTVDITNMTEATSLFPDATTPHRMYNGVPYNQLHVLNVKSTRNNTIMSLTDCAGLPVYTRSAGCEGFKNAKKGTNIAAQQTAITLANNAIHRGITMVRLRIQGIGPGRMGAIKGIQLTGLKVASITDDTRVSWNPPRPRKQRRI